MVGIPTAYDIAHWLDPLAFESDPKNCMSRRRSEAMRTANGVRYELIKRQQAESLYHFHWERPLRQGKLLYTDTVRSFDDETKRQYEEDELRRVYTDFTARDEGRSRTCRGVFNGPEKALFFVEREQQLLAEIRRLEAILNGETDA